MLPPATGQYNLSTCNTLQKKTPPKLSKACYSSEPSFTYQRLSWHAQVQTHGSSAIWGTDATTCANRAVLHLFNDCMSSDDVLLQLHQVQLTVHVHMCWSMSSCPLQAVVDIRHLELRGAARNSSGASASACKYLG